MARKAVTEEDRYNGQHPAGWWNECMECHRFYWCRNSELRKARMNRYEAMESGEIHPCYARALEGKPPAEESEDEE